MTNETISYLTSFIDDLNWPNASKTSEDRKEPRLTRSLLLRVQPLDDDFQIVGSPIQAVSRDISDGGMGFICNQRFGHSYCRICIPGTRVSVIACVRHTRLVGGAPLVFKVGVEYLRGQSKLPGQQTTTDDQSLELEVVPRMGSAG